MSRKTNVTRLFFSTILLIAAVLLFSTQAFSTVIRVPEDYLTIEAALNAATFEPELMVEVGTGEYLGADNGYNIDWPDFSGLTLHGYGTTDSVISAESLGWVISVESSVSLTIEGLTIRDGYVYSGGPNGLAGGIYLPPGSILALNGVLIQHCNNQDTNNGGAVCSDGASVEARDSIFDNNFASSKGAVGYGGDWTVNNCSFNDNFAPSGGGVAYSGNWIVSNSVFNGNRANGGGGVAQYSAWNVTDCGFYYNKANGGAGGVSSGGNFSVTGSIFYGNYALHNGGVDNSSIWTLTNCTFEANKSGDYGGVAYLGTWVSSNCAFIGNFTKSGGVSTNCTLEALNCGFYANTAETVGGVSEGGMLTVTNCAFSGNNSAWNGGVDHGGTWAATNCLFFNNYAMNSAGVTWLGNWTVTNCTFYGNTSEVEAGVGWTCTVGGTNNIFYSNYSINGPVFYGTTDLSNLTYSDVQDFPGTTPSWPANPGNIKLDPKFVSTVEGPGFLELGAASPCIDTGSTDAAPTDYAGVGRPIGFSYDMGAYEFQGPSVSVEAPNGGETFKAGQKWDLKWNISGEVTGNVIVRLSTDGGLTWGTVLTTEAAAEGERTVTLPVPAISSANCLISIEVHNSAGVYNFDSSSSTFTIELLSDVFVSPSGSDTNTGTVESPVMTVSRGLALVAEGGRVNLAAGRYMTAGDYNMTWPSRNNITLRISPESTGTVTLDCINQGTPRRFITISSTVNLSIEGINFVNGYVNAASGPIGGRGGAIYVGASSNIWLKNVTIHYCQAIGRRQRIGSGPGSYYVYYPGQGGAFYFEFPSNLYAWNCIFSSNQALNQAGNGGVSSGPVTAFTNNCVFSNNYALNNYCISEGGNWTCVNCNFYPLQNNTQFSSTPVVTYSDIDPAVHWYLWDILPGGSNNISIEPGYISTTFGNPKFMRVSNSSPLINKGTNESGIGIASKDIDGMPRPHGLISDIGVNEFQGPSLSLLAPNGGGFAPGSPVTIEWTAYDEYGLRDTPPPINIYFSSNGGTNWTLITNEANTGNYLWTAPAELSRQYMISIEAVNTSMEVAFDKSDNMFAVLLPVVYVSTSRGSDETGTGTIEAPYKTVQKGLGTVMDSGTVNVDTGVYHENITWPSSNLITLKPSDETCVCTLDGSGTAPVIYVAYNNNVSLSIESMIIRNGKSSGNGGGILSDAQYSTIWLKNLTGVNCTAENGSGGFIQFGYYSRLEADNCIFAYNGAYYTGSAIHGANSGYSYCRLTNCVIYANRINYASSIGGAVDNCFLETINSIYWANIAFPGLATVFGVLGGATDIRYCDIQKDDWIDSTGNISLEPMLTDSFALGAGSACIDSGTMEEIVPAKDRAGNDRPRNKFVDMGAYEFQGPSIKLITPNGGEFFAPGDVVTIEWAAYDDFGLRGDPPPIRISYSLDSGTSWLFITDEANSGIYTWEAPSSLSPYYLISIEAFNTTPESNYDVSDATFSVLLPEVWVSATTGSDETGTGDINAPFRTVQKGLLSVKVGGTVKLFGGLYNAPGDYNMTWPPVDNITLKSSDETVVCTIDAGGLAGRYVISMEATVNMTIEGVTMRGGKLNPGNGSCLFMQPGSRLWLRNIRISDFVAVGTGGVGGYGGAIYSNGSIVHAYNCIFYNCRAAYQGGVLDGGPGRGVWYTYNCVFSNNRSTGAGGVAAHTVWFSDNSIYWNNYSDSVSNPVFGDIDLPYRINNSDIQKDFVWWPGYISGTGNISMEPKLISTAESSANFMRLGYHSPCIDSGTMEEGIPDRDLSGAVRPYNWLADMGVYEFRGPSVKVIYPNGNEYYDPEVSTQITILWMATDEVGLRPVKPIRISYSKNGGSTWTKITDEANTGIYTWEAPPVPGDAYLISVEAFNSNLIWNYDVSDNAFSILRKVIYVSLSGSDETGNGTLEAPYRTIKRGFSAVSEGGFVKLMPGVYTIEASQVEGYSMVNWPPKNNITLMMSEDATAPVTLDARGYGRLISVEACVNLSIESITLQNGFITYDGYGENSLGGAIVLWGTTGTGGNLWLRDVLFLNNKVRGQLPSFPGGSGGAIGAGGELYGTQNEIHASKCIFRNNSAYREGGAVIYGRWYAENCLFDSNFVLADTGGAVRQGTWDLANCVFINNFAPAGGGVAAASYWPYCVNSIFYNHWYSFAGCTLNIMYSGFDLFEFQAGYGNIKLDPLFISTTEGTPGYLRLKPGSPCIDSGTFEGAPSYDFDGRVRPHGYFHDMGLYESQGPYIKVTSPEGGLEFSPGDNIPITWIASDEYGVSYVNITYSYNNGLTWQPIAMSQPNTGSYTSWNAPAIGYDAFLVSIEAVNSSGEASFDASDTPFTVLLPEVYVTTGGSDETGTGTIESPFRTIYQAMKGVAAGGTVEVDSGNYPALYKGYGYPYFTVWSSKEGVTLKASNETTDIVTVDSDQIIFTVPLSAFIRGIIFRSCYEMILPSGTNLTLFRDQFEAYHQRVINSNGAYVTAESCVFRHLNFNSCYGSVAYGGTWRVVNCSFLNIGNNYTPGGYGSGGVAYYSDWTAINCSFRNTINIYGVNGVIAYGGSMNAENCIFWCPVGGATVMFSGTTGTLKYCDYFPSDLGSIVTENCFSRDPQFSSYFVYENNGWVTTNDAYVKFSSPCINAGTFEVEPGVMAPDTDLDGVSRPLPAGDPSGYDIGCYEYHGPLRVHNQTQHKDYYTIAQAMLEANDHDLITLEAWTYNEHDILWSTAEGVTLRGLGTFETLITGEMVGRVISVESTVSLTIESLSISFGSAESGGAIMLADGSRLKMKDVYCYVNTATLLGGVVYGPNATVEADDCKFFFNVAGWDELTGGGAVAYGGWWYVTNSEFMHNYTGGHNDGAVAYDGTWVATNCAFQNNVASRRGGVFLGGYRDMTNCTFRNNICWKHTLNPGAAADVQWNGTMHARNCIFWGDSDLHPMNDTYYPFEYGSGTTINGSLTNCDVMNNDWGWAVLSGCINLDPRFADPDPPVYPYQWNGYTNIHLQISSPCIDSATFEGAPEYDLDGVHRPQPTADALAFDMGCYEYPYSGGNLKVHNQTQGKVYRLISRAMAEAHAGDLITLEAGYYYEQNIPWAAVNGVTLRGAGEGMSTLDASAYNIYGRAISVEASLSLTIEALTIRYAQMYALEGGAVYIPPGTDLRLKKVRFWGNISDYGGAVYSDGASVTAENCIFNDNGANFAGGVAYGGTWEAVNCTFYANIAGGLANIFTNGTWNARNCIFWSFSPDNPENYPYDFISAEGKLRYCDITKEVGSLLTEECFSKRPKFANVSGNNRELSLQTGSPCIDVGTKDGTPADINGVSRPKGSRYDIGAYEFDVGIPRVHNATQGIAYYTISAALMAADPGDLITLEAGMYYEQNIRWDKDNVTLSGEGYSLCTIDAYDPYFRSRVISVIGPISLTIEGVTMQNGYVNDDIISNGLEGGGINLESGARLFLYGVYFYNNYARTWGGAVNARGAWIYAKDSIFDQNGTWTVPSDPSGGGGFAIFGGTCEAVNSVFIKNWTFLAYGGAPIQDCDFTGTNCLFYRNNNLEGYRAIPLCGVFYGGKQNLLNCTFQDNKGQYGTVANQSELTAVNCIFWSSDDYGVPFYFGTSTLVNCDSYKPGGTNINCLSTDPHFVNDPKNSYAYPNIDLRLKSGSPCIDRGTSEGASVLITTEAVPSFDMDYVARPNPTGCNFDIGAYEYHVTGAGMVHNQTQGKPYYTISAAFSEAREGDFITLEAGTYTEHELDWPMLNNISMRGAGSAESIISAEGISCVIALNTSEVDYYGDVFNISLEAMTIRDGRVGNNGAALRLINGPQMLRLKEVNFKNNISMYPYMGGAICMSGIQEYYSDNIYWATIEALNCSFVSNEAVRGGAIATQALLNIIATNCAFENNKAIRQDGVFHSNMGALQLALSGCSFTGNRAEQTIYSHEGASAGICWLGVGGYTGGTGETISVSSKFRADNCVFTGNGAINRMPYTYSFIHGDRTAVGGVIEVAEDGNITIEVTNCYFKGNYAANDGGSRPAGGGVIFGGSVHATNCTFEGNLADCGGVSDRTVWVAADCQFIGNIGSQEGGVAFSKSNNSYLPYNWTATNCQFIGNKSIDRYSAYQNGGVASFYNEGSSFKPKWDLNNCVFSGNRASSGGVFYCNENIYSINAYNCTFEGNLATNGGVQYFGTLTSTNCVFANSGLGNGTGGTFASLQKLKLFSCTVANSRAIYGSSVAGSNIYAINTIFWGNSSDQFDSATSGLIKYCDVQGADWDFLVAFNCIAKDPHLVQSGPMFMRLGPGSRAMDMGTSETAPYLDFAGYPRPHGFGYDIGAYEFQGPSIRLIKPKGGDSLFGHDSTIIWDISPEGYDLYARFSSDNAVNWSAPITWEPWSHSGISTREWIIPGVSSDLCFISIEAKHIEDIYLMPVWNYDINEDPFEIYTLSTEVWVSFTHGSDESGSGRMDDPFQTIGFAMTRVATDGVVYAYGDTYYEHDVEWAPYTRVTLKPSTETTLATIDAEGNGRCFVAGGVLFTNLTERLENFHVTGGTTIGNGGGIYLLAGVSFEAVNCKFTSNEAAWGGAVSSQMTNSAFNGYNCIFWDNRATTAGGVLHAGDDSVNCYLYNCTMYNNKAPRGGAIGLQNGYLHAYNCIVWKNIGMEQIYQGGSGYAYFDYSDIQGGWSGTGNIIKDPLFISESTRNLHINRGSPCTDKGTSAGAPLFDYDWNIRPYGNAVDMGAYEYQGLSILIIQPASGETVMAGTPYNITYAISPEASHIYVRISTDGGLTWQLLTEESGTFTGVGTYEWTPSPSFVSMNCYISIEASYGSDSNWAASDWAFSVLAAGVVTDINITREGDAPGSHIQIGWTTVGNVDIWTKLGTFETNSALWALAFSNVSGSTFVDTTPSGEVGNGIIKWYKIIASGSPLTDGDLTIEVLGKYDITCEVGPNLISLPVIPFSNNINSSVGNQLTGGNPATGDKIYSFINGSWVSAFLNASGKWGPLATVEADRGYWFVIESINPSKIISFVGKISNTDRSVPLDTGSNLVGSSFPISVALNSSALGPLLTGGTPATADTVYAYSASSWISAYVKADHSFGGPLTRFQPARGYWVSKQSAGSITWDYPKLY